MKGYAGRMLFVNLSDGSIKEEKSMEKMYRDFIGGYGVTAKVFYERMKPKADPLGPDNMLGFMVGPQSLSTELLWMAKPARMTRF